jgi:hypothetical protein
MQTPVKESLWLRTNRETIEKITALAQQSMLTVPSCDIFAIWFVEWKALLESRNIQIQVLLFPEEATIQVEIWKYSPKIFQKEES